MTRGDRANGAGGRFPFWRAGSDLAASLCGFSFAVWLYGGMVSGNYLGPWPAQWIRHVIVSAVIAWIAIASTRGAGGDGVRLWVDRLFTAVGFNLLLQYGLAYLFHIPPTPWPVAVAGSALTVVLSALAPRRLRQPFPAIPGGALLLGYDSAAEAIQPVLGNVIGVLDRRPERISSRTGHPPVLGDLSRFADVVAERQPGLIIINESHWSSAIPPSRLLALRYAGVAIEDGATLFENILKRVCWQRLDSFDLLLSPRLSINRAALALQAVYTNLIGLTLLALFSPVLLAAAILTALTTASLPIEGQECLGIQRIPFRCLRFRTRRPDGRPIWSGAVLSKLHLTNLPRLINVVRGEMALFGPPPVRKEFAERMAQLVPVHAQRFIVKPGIMGWSQANLAPAPGLADESLRLEYDLYYIREESPSLDLDIVFRTVFRAPLHPDDSSR